ncbi:MAG: hypothetical protein ACKVHE_15695 [Planctomycetales bacterium]
MDQFIEGCFSWPSYPQTFLLLLVCAYWCFVMLGALDMDVLDFDIDLDADMDASILQVGFIPLKWLNIGSVPTMLWLSVFALTWWMASRLINSPASHPNLEMAADGLAILRDTGIAVFITKCLTQPLRGRFDPKEVNLAKDLIGGNCKVTTSEVTESFGEAEYSTDGAPLKLRVRAEETNLVRGDEAVIVGFQREQNVYLIKRSERGA